MKENETAKVVVHIFPVLDKNSQKPDQNSRDHLWMMNSEATSIIPKVYFAGHAQKHIRNHMVTVKLSKKDMKESNQD